MESVTVKKTVTTRLKVTPGSGCVKSSIEVGDRKLEVVLDGRVDPAIQDACESGFAIFKSLEQLQPLLPGVVDRTAEALKKRPGQNVAVDVGLGDDWVAQGEQNGPSRLWSGNLNQLITLEGNRVLLTTDPDNLPVRHTIDARWNRETGTLTCLGETFEVTTETTSERN